MLRKIALTICALWMVHPSAATFGFVPQETGAQKEFAAQLEKRNWNGALAAWNQAVSGTSFAASANGQALHAYLLHHNGLPLIAIENVQQINPKNISPELINLWKAEFKNSGFVQRSYIDTPQLWTSIIGPGKINLTLNNKAQIKKAMQLAQKLPADQLREKTSIWWQVATRAPLIDDTVSALEALKLLKESGQNIIEADQMAITKARILYQRGDLDQAVKTYREVPKSSDLWFYAVEERAWAQLKKDNFDGALGDVTTLLAPTFDKLVGPEPYYLANLLNLRVCDYSRIFKVNEMFKARHRERLSELQALATKGLNKAVSPALEQLDKKGVNIQGLGAQAEFLPRNVLKDQEFRKQIQYRKQLLTEIKRSSEIASSNETLGNNSELEKLTAEAKTRADLAKSKAIARLRTLAQLEVKEYKQVLNKLHIIEAQVIERMHLDDSLRGDRGQLAKVEDSGDVLVFQYNDEVWLDELDNYKARVKDCPTLKGASL